MLIPPKIFAIASHCDTNSKRFALGAVLLERDENGVATAIATDGRRLIAVEWAEDDAAEYPADVVDSVAAKPGFKALVPVKACTDLSRVKIKAKKRLLRNIAIDENAEADSNGYATGRLSIGSTDLTDQKRYDTRATDGRFPKWKDVYHVVDRDRSASVRIDAGYLADVANAIAKITDDGSKDFRAKVTLTIPTGLAAGKAVLFSSCGSGGERVCAAVMPVATEDDALGAAVDVPQWHPNGKSGPELRADWILQAKAEKADAEAASTATLDSPEIAAAIKAAVDAALAAAKIEADEQLQIAIDTAKRLRKERDQLASEAAAKTNANIDLCRRLGEAEKLCKSYAADQYRLGAAEGEAARLREELGRCRTELTAAVESSGNHDWAKAAVAMHV